MTNETIDAPREIAGASLLVGAWAMLVSLAVAHYRSTLAGYVVGSVLFLVGGRRIRDNLEPPTVAHSRPEVDGR